MRAPIDATLPEYFDVPLWAVYGPDCFPTMFCCKVLDHDTCGLTLWGYSIYRRQPGFRTLGVDLREWTAENKAKFFARQDDALAHLGKITTPRC